MLVSEKQIAKARSSSAMIAETLRFRYCYSVMANNIIKQAEPHIREIIRICRVLKAEGRELDELNELVGRTSKFG